MCVALIVARTSASGIFSGWFFARTSSAVAASFPAIAAPFAVIALTRDSIAGVVAAAWRSSAIAVQPARRLASAFPTLPETVTNICSKALASVAGPVGLASAVADIALAITSKARFGSWFLGSAAW